MHTLHFPLTYDLTIHGDCRFKQGLGKHGLQWAIFSADEQYRYALGLRWANEGKEVHFLLHNPSTATELALDPTLRSCRAIAVAHGYSAMSIGNRLASGRSSNPQDCLALADPVGEHTDAYLGDMWKQAHTLVVGWGNCVVPVERAQVIRQHLQALDKPIYCLGLTKTGEPRHPGALGRYRVQPQTPLEPYYPKAA